MMSWQYPEVAKHHASWASFLESNSNYDLAIVFDMLHTCISKNEFKGVIKILNEMADDQGPIMGAEWARRAHLAEMLAKFAIRSKEVFNQK